MRKNKKEGAQNLKNAVAAQQRALAILAQREDQADQRTYRCQLCPDRGECQEGDLRLLDVGWESCLLLPI